MSAFLVDPDDVRGDSLCLRDEEAHHVRVRRIRPGERCDVIDGRGTSYEVELREIGDDRVEADILGVHEGRGERRTMLHLAAALTKGQRFDYAVEKATEVGVASIIPVETARTVARQERGQKRVERWRRLAVAAAKQAGRSVIPEIGDVTKLEEVADGPLADVDMKLMASARGSEELSNSLSNSGAGRSALLFIGPEGCFCEAEETFLRNQGARAFTWGSSTLRADTACVVLSALVLDALEDPRRGRPSER
ncbi:MAG: RsmE family RNA methyltransferase [Candidatus Latescibacterota bacterium]|nr:RsmE family RNA methyltransferase [Candidatus Latescibacterota bacterium]